MLFSLNVLGEVRPMNEKSVERFRTANAQGYFATSAILLAANGSAPALRLFESTMLDRAQSVDTRIASLHYAVYPRRTSLPILQSAENIVKQAQEPRLMDGVIEPVFDYHVEWFRPANAPAKPPAWDSAPRESLAAALQLAELAHKRRLPAALRAAVDRESASIHKALDGKR